MGYIKTDSNMGITFRARYSYNFAIPAHILIFTNYKFGLNFLNNEIKFVTKHKNIYVYSYLVIFPN